jgi:hypothetical protein
VSSFAQSSSHEGLPLVRARTDDPTCLLQKLNAHSAGAAGGDKPFGPSGVGGHAGEITVSCELRDPGLGAKPGPTLERRMGRYRDAAISIALGLPVPDQAKTAAICGTLHSI